jgi:cytochrome P450
MIFGYSYGGGPLRQDPSLIPAVLRESLSIESPIKLAYRIATREVGLKGE